MAIPIEHKTLSNSGQWWVVMQATGISGGTITVYEGTQAETQLLIGTHYGPYSSLADANKEASTLQTNNQTVAGSIKAGVPGLPNFESWILRGGEIILGIVLLAIGLNALLKNPAGKIADLTPAGKIARAVK